MVAEDEKIATQRHRRRVSDEGEHRVIHAVPVAYKWVDEIENKEQRDKRLRQPPSPRLQKRRNASLRTGFEITESVRRVCRQGYLGQRVELPPDHRAA